MDNQDKGANGDNGDRLIRWPEAQHESAEPPVADVHIPWHQDPASTAHEAPGEQHVAISWSASPIPDPAGRGAPPAVVDVDVDDVRDGEQAEEDEQVGIPGSADPIPDPAGRSAPPAVVDVDVDGDVDDVGDGEQHEQDDLGIDWDSDALTDPPAVGSRHRVPTPEGAAMEDWEAWRKDFVARLGQAASSLRDFAAWAEARGLHGLDMAALDDVAGQLEGRVRRLSTG